MYTEHRNERKTVAHLLAKVFPFLCLQPCIAEWGSYMWTATNRFSQTHHFIVTKLWALYRSQWPRGLRRGSAAARLIKVWVRIPSGSWIFVTCDCCVLWGRGFCVVPRNSTECDVSECDRLVSLMRRPWPSRGCCVMRKMHYIKSLRFSFFNKPIFRRD